MKAISLLPIAFVFRMILDSSYVPKEDLVLESYN
jgi:hypothetical protein